MYQKLYERLGLDPNIDTLTIYLITQPRNVDGYTTDTFGKLTLGFKEADMPKLHFQVVKSDWKLSTLK